MPDTPLLFQIIKLPPYLIQQSIAFKKTISRHNDLPRLVLIRTSFTVIRVWDYVGDGRAPATEARSKLQRVPSS